MSMAGKWTEEKLAAERERLARMREYEDTYAAVSLICGVDEAGRGPLAGPVVAGAVILPRDCEILRLNDSKKLSEKRREELFLEIRDKAVAWSVGIASPEEIDRILAELSADCAAHREDIAQNYDLLIMLDVIFARAKLSYRMRASEPKVVSRGICLRQARHPLRLRPTVS